MKSLSRVRTLYRVTTKLGIDHAFRLMKKKLFRSSDSTYESGINSIAGLHRVTAEVLVSSLFTNQEEKVQCMEKEYEDYMEKFSRKQTLPRKDFFESIFDLGPNLLKFLYIVIRLSNPERVIETGIAAGASTNTLLSALRKNGIGSLTSIDVTSRVGELVQQDLKDIWDKKVISTKDSEAGYLEVLRTASNASIFLHDSDHSFDWQVIEFDGVRQVLKNCDLIAFDDVSSELIKYIFDNYADCEIYLFDEKRKYSAVILIRN
jgi:predicted O-methyltransferase YrrM